MKRLFSTVGLLFAFFWILCAPAMADVPVYTDSRIKTFIYNEYEIYRLAVHYGFQTNIEFGDGEEVETLSIGDSFAWKVSAVGKRLFIKPLEENIHTNMTILTNRHTYNFEIISVKPGNDINDLLAYVVRFYYPEQDRASSYSFN